MLTARLNPTLQRELRILYSKHSSLQCILDFPTVTSKGKVTPAECKRFQRLEEDNHRLLIQRCSIKIQSLIRMHFAKKELRKRRWVKQKADELAAVIVLQKHTRMILAKNQLKLLRTVKAILDVRKEAATCIQRRFRQFNMSFDRQVQAIMKIRADAATAIQARCKGFLVRKDLEPMRNHPRLHLLIRWQSHASSAFLIGTFTTPPWTQQIKMKYSRYMGEFYSTYLMDNILTSGKYYMKFIIDGQWVCDGHYPIEQDEKGSFNNVIMRTGDRNRIKKSLSVHGLKQVEQSLSTQQIDLPMSLVRSNSGNFDQERVFDQERARHTSRCAVGLSIAGCMVAHPKSHKHTLSPEGSSDAFFINTEMQCFGVADGVGEWQHYGLNPSFYTNEFIAHCDALLSRELRMLDEGYSSAPLSEVCRNVMEHAFRMTENYGSSTVVVAAFRDNVLSFASLGDSGIIILRVRDPASGAVSVIFRSVEQQHAFNCPFQLTHLPRPEEYESLKSMGLGSLSKVLKRAGQIFQDSSTDAHCEEIPLQVGDIAIVATDGLFDNLFDHDIARLVERHLESEENAAILAARLAQVLTEAAIEKGWDSTYKSPFAKHAQKHGKRHMGGKLDDTTVIVAVAGS